MTRSPRAVPWERTLPWATISIKQTADDDHGRGCVCARAVGKSSSRDVGTSATARIPNACVPCAAGKRPSVRRNGVPMKRSNPNTPPPNVRTDSVPPRPNHPRLPKLRRRVVTQQNFFRGPCATGPGAINHPRSRDAPRLATAAPPVVRQFAACAIVNASGNSVARSEVARHAGTSTRPRALDAALNQPIQPVRPHHHGRPRERTADSAGRRSMAGPWPRPNLGPGFAPVLTGVQT